MLTAHLVTYLKLVIEEKGILHFVYSVKKVYIFILQFQGKFLLNFNLFWYWIRSQSYPGYDKKVPLYFCWFWFNVMQMFDVLDNAKVCTVIDFFWNFQMLKFVVIGSVLFASAFATYDAYNNLVEYDVPLPMRHVSISLFNYLSTLDWTPHRFRWSKSRANSFNLKISLKVKVKRKNSYILHSNPFSAFQMQIWFRKCIKVSVYV